MAFKNVLIAILIDFFFTICIKSEKYTLMSKFNN